MTGIGGGRRGSKGFREDPNRTVGRANSRMEMTGGSMSRPGEVEMAKKMGSERVGGDARFFSIFRERGPGQPPERRPSGARKTKVMERRWKGDGTTEEGKLEAEQMWSRVEKR